MEKVAGFLGVSVAFVATIISTAAGLVVLGVFLQAGLLPVIGEGFLIILRALFITIPVETFGFFRDLLIFYNS